MAWMSGVATSGAMAGAGSDDVSPSARAAMACLTVSIVVSGEPTHPASATVMSAVPRFARPAEGPASTRARPFHSTLPNHGVASALATPHPTRPGLFPLKRKDGGGGTEGAG